MAEQSVNLLATKSAYLMEDDPYTPHPTSTGTSYLLSLTTNGKGRRLLFYYEALPDALKRYALKRVQFMLYCSKGQYGTDDLYVYAYGDFDPATITWDNASRGYYSVGRYEAPISQALAWANRLSDPYHSDAASRSQDAAEFLKRGGAQFFDSMGSNIPGISASFVWYGRTMLSGGGAPYAQIVYDDAVTIKSKPSLKAKLASYFNTSKAQTVSWDLVSDNSTYHCADENWEQDSAVFYWRYSGGSTWNQIAVSGSAQAVTIPAYTFESGSTVEYYVATTDTDGTTASSATFSVTAAKTQVTVTAGPTSGYKDPRTATTFDGYFTVEKSSDVYPTGSMSLFYKEAGAANYTEVSFTDLTTPIVIPANTFNTGTTVSWYLSGTDGSGYASTSPVYTFSTAAGTATAVAQAPIGSAEDGSAPIQFRWLLTTADGQAVSRTRVWWKLPTEDNNSWHVLVDVNEAIYSYTAAAGTFSAGTIQWKVQAFNVDGTAGPWDANIPNAKEFLCVMAPTPPAGLTTDNMPFVTVSWQSSEQQAYEISIDGKVVQTAFGADVYSWTSPDYLADGAHEIRVRVQGAFGLWSQPSTVACVISNQSSDSLTLFGDFEADARLEWSTGSARTDFLIYRDGVRIGHTAQSSFADRTVLGEHDWTVINRLADGNYDKSNTIRATLETDVSLIADLSEAGSSWIRLRLSERSAGVQMFQKTRTHSLRHFCGAAYPVMELSPFTDLSASYDTAFLPEDPGAEALEALFGKTVILKSRRGNVMIGVLVQLTKSVEDFYTIYSFSLQRIHWEDYRDDAGN